jgi:F-type H+-transporting ATPase subunit epsilon
VATLELTIVTPEGPVYQGTVNSVVLPGSEGQFGVLPEHVRFLAPLKIGEAMISPRDGSDFYAAISGGFTNIDDDKVTVLADTCEMSHDIDVARAKRASERAEKHIKEFEAEQEEAHSLKEQQAALERALNRITISGRV